ncbi:MAG: type II toxin-antitoxin system VapC family toxin [Pirellulales bacterium]
MLDASVAACWVLRNPLQVKALKLRTEYEQNIHELIARSHFPGEIASALTKAERQKLIPVGDALLLIQDILKTPPVLYAIDSLYYRAVEISSNTRTAFYDCLYVALAERQNCELITVDDKLINALQRQFSFILSLASLP